MTNDTKCPDADSFTTSFGLKIVLSCQVVLCLLSIVATAYCLQKHIRGLFHPNYRILLSAYLTMFLLHSLFLGTIQSYHIYSYSFLEACDIYVNIYYCFLFRHSTEAFVTIMTFIELSMVVERAVALHYRGQYDTFHGTLGILLVLASVVLGEALVLILQHYSFPLHGSMKYCSAVTFYKHIYIFDVEFDLGNIWVVCIGVVEMFSLSGLFILRSKTRNMAARCVRKDYNLANRFEEYRNLDVLSGLLPTMICHSVYFIVFSIIQYIVFTIFTHLEEVQFKILGAAVYIYPVYTFLAPLLMIYMQKKNRRRVETTNATGDDYFKTYSALW